MHSGLGIQYPKNLYWVSCFFYFFINDLGIGISNVVAKLANESTTFRAVKCKMEYEELQKLGEWLASGRNESMEISRLELLERWDLNE